MTTENSFASLGLDEDLLEALSDLGYETPTPIQEQAVKALLGGVDLIGQSKTGTGKTAAFGLPLIELVDPDDRSLQALVLCPTRELCMQAAEDLRSFLKYKAGIRVVPLYGGEPIGHQIKDLAKGAQIVTATPGRFLDHLRRRTVKPSGVQMVVLDEADVMLDMGFLEDVDFILAQMPPLRQTVLFSATMPEDVVTLSQKYMEDPVIIRMDEEETLTADGVSQYYYEMRPGLKDEALLRILDAERPDRTLIFCNTKKKAEELTSALRKAHLMVEALHGDLKQTERDIAIRRFKSGSLPLLVATDVAARGLDINNVELVINYDLPEDKDFYIHRIGRTARAGKVGRAYSFVSERELPRLKELCAYTKAEVTPRRVPTQEDLEQARRDRLVSALKKILGGEKAGGATTYGNPEKYRPLLDSLRAEGHSDEEIALASLTLMLYEAEGCDISAGASFARTAPLAASRAAAAGTDAFSKAPKRLDSDSTDMMKLHFNVGKKQHLRVKDLTRLIEEKCGITSQQLGRIDLLETFSYVEVPSAYASDVVSSLDGERLDGRLLKVSIAQK